MKQEEKLEIDENKLISDINNYSNHTVFEYKSFYRSSIENIKFPSKSLFLNSSFKECSKLKEIEFLGEPNDILFETESFAFSCI